jgi:hypothetical protein
MGRGAPGIRAVVQSRLGDGTPDHLLDLLEARLFSEVDADIARGLAA